MIAFITGATLAAKEAKRQGLNPDDIFNLCFVAFISGVLGGRIFYVLENLKVYLANPLEIIMFQHGGLAVFGGIIAGVISAVIFLKRKKLPVLKTLDLLVPFVALAQAIGRLGCLLNGCCYGKTAVPVQVYSSLLLVLIFLILRFFQAKPHKSGEIFFMYLLLYSLKRFFIEFWRLDNPAVFMNLTLFQVLGAVVFLAAAISLIKCKITR